MSYRNFACLLALVPVLGWSQVPAVDQGPLKGAVSEHFAPEMNAETRAVVLANCPTEMSEADWLRLMQNPVSRSFHPLRISQTMLDTLDGRKLDLRFQYILVKEVERR